MKMLTMKLNSKNSGLTLAGLMLLMMCSRGAVAADFGAALSVGSAGLGLHASVPLQEVNIRFGVNYFKGSTVLKDPNGDTSIDITLNTFEALLDWFPTGSEFHLTGGLAYNGNKLDTITKINGVTYEGTVFNPSFGSLGQVDGRFNVGNTLSPYIGIGWGNELKQNVGWHFSSELGLLFHGKPKISLQSSACTADFITCSLVAQKVADEEVKVNEEYANKIVYPVARVGVSYLF
jgi:hypothetical protein